LAQSELMHGFRPGDTVTCLLVKLTKKPTFGPERSSTTSPPVLGISAGYRRTILRFEQIAGRIVQIEFACAEIVLLVHVHHPPRVAVTFCGTRKPPKGNYVTVTQFPFTHRRLGKWYKAERNGIIIFAVELFRPSRRVKRGSVGMFERQNLFLAEIVDLVQLWKSWRSIVFIVYQIVAAEHWCTARSLRQPQ
jgi:hypothetical protein